MNGDYVRAWKLSKPISRNYCDNSLERLRKSTKFGSPVKIP